MTKHTAMTKGEYLDLVAKLYRVANMSDSDNPMRPRWLKGDESTVHCQAYDAILHHMGVADHFFDDHEV